MPTEINQRGGESRSGNNGTVRPTDAEILAVLEPFAKAYEDREYFPGDVRIPEPTIMDFRAAAELYTRLGAIVPAV